MFAKTETQMILNWLYHMTTKKQLNRHMKYAS
jgi:hypothetical protein